MAPKERSRAAVYKIKSLSCNEAIRTGGFVRYRLMLSKVC